MKGPARAADPSQGRPVAYLTSVYPKASHTFILREIAGLRALGVRVAPFSIRRAAGSELIGPEERDAQAETSHVLEAARNPVTLLRAHLGLLRAHPARWTGALSLALRARRPGLRGLLWQLFYFAEAGVLAARLRAIDAAHLHCHFASGACTVAMLAARMTGTPYSFTLHGPADLFEAGASRLDLKIARAAFVACISWFARSQAMLFSDPAHWDKLAIVRCGVDPARYDHPPPPDRPGLRLLFVGRLAAVKGLRVLLEAVTQARAIHGDVTLSLIGDGPDRAALEALAAPLGDAVRFHGYQSQDAVAAALGDADAFILPSFAEGVPVVLMEAMAGRRPVIATQVAGVSELVENGVSGLLTPPGHAAALTEAILALRAEPERRRRMGEAGRAKVIAAFETSAQAARLRDLLADARG